METKTTVELSFFDQALVQRIIEFQESNDKTKEEKEALVQEIKNIYNQKDLELKEYITKELVNNFL